MIPPLPSNTSSFVLRRAFTASRQRVFRAWTDREVLQHWFKPMGMDMIISKLDVRVGGSFCFDSEDGSSTVGTYLQIIPPEKLVFTWSGAITQGGKTIVTLDFFDQGPVTEVVLTHERLSTPELHTLFETGWSSLFDTLADVLSTYLIDDILFK